MSLNIKEAWKAVVAGDMEGAFAVLFEDFKAFIDKMIGFLRDTLEVPAAE